MKNNKKRFIFTKRDLKYVPFCAILLIGGIFLFYYGIRGLIDPFWVKMTTENIYEIYFLNSLGIFGGFICFGFIHYFLWKRELRLSNWGIQYYIGNKLKLGVSWKNVNKIRTTVPIMLLAHDVIVVYRKYTEPNGEIGESNYIIQYLSTKERIAAFKKMAEFASEYNIEINDELKYLDK